MHQERKYICLRFEWEDNWKFFAWPIRFSLFIDECWKNNRPVYSFSLSYCKIIL